MIARRILVTNDDGIDAPGLAALVSAARSFGEPFVVAPHVCHSAKSHAISMRGALEVRRVASIDDAPAWECTGTPADCVRLGLLELGLDDISIVLSGINPGANLGVDTFYSGTVAAAREAAILGRVGVAVSQLVLEGRIPPWDVASARALRALERVLADSDPGDRFFNINLPVVADDHAPPLRVCRLSTDPWPLEFERGSADRSVERLETRYVGRYTTRQTAPDSDFHALVAGAITITPLRLDNTDGDLLSRLANA